MTSFSDRLSTPRKPALRWLTLCAGALLLIAGCATRPPPAPSTALPLPEAAAAGLDQLLPGVATPAWLTALKGRSLVIEPVRDSVTNQQTRATQATERALAERLRAAYPQVQVLPLAEASIAQATWALSSTLLPARADARGPAAKGSTLQLALREIKTGAVVAQTRVEVRSETIDSTPTPFFQDSPVLMSAPPETLAALGLIETLNADALCERATRAYEAGRFGEALALFEAARKAPGADPLRVETGVYLANSRLGRQDEARQAFGNIAAIGIARRTLGVKFLFAPGKTEFWNDPAVSAPYAMWLEQIAARAQGKGLCMKVVGHASRTGSDEFNDKLSLDRAIQIGDTLKRLAPELARQLQETGMGTRENLIGSGTDDARDALDRRVEFRFDNC